MFIKRIFDIAASLVGLLLIWWVFPIVAILIRIKMPGGPAFFCQNVWARTDGCSLATSSAP